MKLSALVTGVGLVAALILTSVAHAQGPPAGPNAALGEILAELGALHDKLDALQADNGPLGIMQAELEGLQNRINELHNKTDGLHAKTDALNIKTDSLNTKTDALHAKTDALQTDVDGLASQVSNLQTEIGTVQTTVEAIPTETDLRGVTQNWDKQLDSTNGDFLGCNSDRFTCIFPSSNPPFLGLAVRDNETGLVWERRPENDGKTWSAAQVHCINRTVGPTDKKGWRLPAIAELASLMVTTSESCTNEGVCLPDGHPFVNVQGATYWSATTVVGVPEFAWSVGFGFGGVTNDGKLGPNQAWCVRGNMNAEGY